MANYDKLVDRYYESKQRFDYFLTGLSAAVLAYSVQSFDSGNYTNYLYFAPIAWGFLVIAGIAGIIGSERIVTILSIDTEKFIKQNTVQTIRNNIPQSLINASKLEEQWKELPEELKPEGMEKWIKESIDTHSKSIEIINSLRNNASKSAKWAYKVRELFFVAGLILLGILRILKF